MTLKIDKTQNKILINGVEVNDPTEIGIAVLNYVKPKKPCPDAVLSRLKRYAVENHLTITEERMIILGIMLQQNNPFTIAHIFNSIQYGISISLQTVHRAVNLYKKAKVVQPLSIQPIGVKSTLYEII